MGKHRKILRDVAAYDTVTELLRLAKESAKISRSYKNTPGINSERYHHGYAEGLLRAVRIIEDRFR